MQTTLRKQDIKKLRVTLGQQWYGDNSGMRSLPISIDDDNDV